MQYINVEARDDAASQCSPHDDAACNMQPLTPLCRARSSRRGTWTTAQQSRRRCSTSRRSQPAGSARLEASRRSSRTWSGTALPTVPMSAVSPFEYLSEGGYRVITNARMRTRRDRAAFRPLAHSSPSLAVPCTSGCSAPTHTRTHTLLVRCLSCNHARTQRNATHAPTKPIYRSVRGWSGAEGLGRRVSGGDGHK